MSRRNRTEQPSTQQPEEQPGLPGIPKADARMFRVNFQYQGPKYALRSGSLIIPAERIEVARQIAEETIRNTHGKAWFNIGSIVQLQHQEETPF